MQISRYDGLFERVNKEVMSANGGKNNKNKTLKNKLTDQVIPQMIDTMKRSYIQRKYKDMYLISYFSK